MYSLAAPGASVCVLLVCMWYLQMEDEFAAWRQGYSKDGTAAWTEAASQLYLEKLHGEWVA